MKKAMNLKEANSMLAEQEARRRGLLTEISAGEAGLRGIELDLTRAEGFLSAERAAASAGAGLLERRGEMKRWEREISILQKKKAATSEDLNRKSAALEEASAEIERIRLESLQPRERAVTKRVLELAVDAAEKHAALLGVHKQAVALYLAVEAKTPRRVVYMRTEPVRYLKVQSDNPALAHCTTRDEKGVGIFHVELLRALDGERKGKWKIAEGQNLEVRPEEIEVLWSDGSMPTGLAWIRDLHVGDLLTVNGKGPVIGPRELDFTAIANLLSPEDVAAAKRFVEEGV